MSGFINIASLVQQVLGICTGMGLTVPVVYTIGGHATYNPSTGAVTNTSKTLSFNAVFVRFGESEIETEARSAELLDKSIVVSTDSKMLVSGLDLTVEPTHTDTLIAS